MARLQHFAEALGQAGRTKNFAKEQDRAAGILNLRDVAKGAAEFSVTRELVGSGIQPGVDRGIGHAEFGLQFAGIPWRIVDQESRVDPEKAGQQIARSIGHVRARAAFDLGEVGLT